VRRAALATVAVVALAGCGSSGTPAARALRSTARNLDHIRSATLDLHLSAESPGAKGPVGFAITGPVAFADGPPVADVKVTELRGGRTYESSFVSTGTAAYVVRAGRVTALPGGAGLDVGGPDANGLGALRIDRWLRAPRMADGGEVGGTRADHISAGLDVAAAFDDLGRLGERLGTSALAALKPLDAASRTRLANAARDSSVEVWTGHSDHLLRRLVLKVTLTTAGDVPEALRALVPVTLSLSLSLADLNQPVHVEPPKT
jgi:hypothetical protein